MKKVMVTGIFMCCTVGIFAQAKTDNLPKTAQEFIAQHFSSVTTEEVKENSSWQLWEDEKYEVRLSNGVELDFDENGNIIEIDGENNSSIPESALPSNIVTYLKTNHSDSQIVGWEMKDNEQEVELSDGTEIEFDSQGKFLRID